MGGLFVRDRNLWLACSPDGLAKDDSSAEKFGILEIKCPFSSEPVSNLMKSTSFYLYKRNGETHLKQNHEYFIQVQHHMAVLDRPWCDFTAFTAKNSTFSIVVMHVSKNEEFWASHFLKLEKFFMDVAIPEIAQAAIQSELLEVCVQDE